MEDLLLRCEAEANAHPNWCFASDNTGTMHPKVLECVSRVNTFPSLPPYGDDVVTEAAARLVRETLGFAEEDHVRFVATGTGGNVLALSLLCPRTMCSIVGARCAHVFTHTCGVSEKILGCKMLLLEEDKVTPAALDSTVRHCLSMPQAFTTPRAVTLTLLTEKGDLYSLAELEAVSRVAKQHDLLLHIDGARLSNACVALAETEGITAVEVARRVAAVCDALTFGGTKNGLGTSEAVIIRRKVEPSEMVVKGVSKQINVIVSKARFVSCQFIAFFSEGLWVSNAENANSRARLIHSLLEEAGVASTRPAANMSTVTVTCSQFDSLSKHYSIYSAPHPTDSNLLRLRVVTSFESTEEDCRRFVKLLKA